MVCSVLLKALWERPQHREAILAEASRAGRQFVRFVNMLMNDTTFLLDESLESLKRLHQAAAMDWDALPPGEQQGRRRQLALDERQCRSYLTLARETVDTLHYLTAHVPDPFLRPVSTFPSWLGGLCKRLAISSNRESLDISARFAKPLEIWFLACKE